MAPDQGTVCVEVREEGKMKRMPGNKLGGQSWRADIGQRWFLQASASCVRTALSQSTRPVIATLDQPLPCCRQSRRSLRGIETSDSFNPGGMSGPQKQVVLTKFTHLVRGRMALVPDFLDSLICEIFLGPGQGILELGLRVTHLGLVGTYWHCDLGLGLNSTFIICEVKVVVLWWW